MVNIVNEGNDTIKNYHKDKILFSLNMLGDKVVKMVYIIVVSLIQMANPKSEITKS